MTITINHNHYFHSENESQILKQLLLITKNTISIMSKLDDINALVSGINDSTNNIAADLERIAGTLVGGLTSAEADSVVAELQTAADKLKAVADINPEPTA